APDQRATLPRLRRYLETIGHLAPRTQAIRFHQLHRVLSSAFPEADWRALKNGANALNRREKEAGRARILDQVPPSDALLDAGFSAIEDARSRIQLTPRLAEHWRNGLIVVMLACHAPRRRTIAALRLGINLRRDGDGFAVRASGADMKAGRPFTFRVSSILTDAIEDYLSHARPVFPNGDDPDLGPLWLSFITGRALGPQGIKNAAAAITKANCGHRTTPHTFRHAATTTMANAEGFDACHAQAFLDHRTPEITERHYNLATQLDAGRAYAKLLEQKRKGKASRR
ncbi:MAG: site-specific integrase, partial [Pseudomonadota bacterium]